VGHRNSAGFRLRDWSIENRFDEALQRGRIEETAATVARRKSSGKYLFRQKGDFGMPSESDHAAQIRRVYAGELTDDEKNFLLQLKEHFTAVAEKRAQFNLIVEVIAARLPYVIRGSLEPNLASNIDSRFFEETDRKSIPHLGDNSETTMAEKLKFAGDVVGAIDFTLRNGVGIGFFLNMLSHDLREMLSYGGLAEMLSEQVVPKCSGYSQFTAQAIGDPEVEEN
jgi:hypothetical protein